MKASTAILAGAGLAISAVLGFSGVAAAEQPADCEARLQVLADAEAEFKSAVAVGERRANELGLSAGAIAFGKAALNDGLTAAEKAELLVHIPAVIAGGGGGDADVKLALRVEAAANALNTAQDNAEDCDEPTPPPAVPADLDCNDFPLADGRTALDVLKETPDVDEHNLDNNGNGVPCEAPDNDAQDDVVPDTSNGVATGVA
jgi:hypothetical protein